MLFRIQREANRKCLLFMVLLERGEKNGREQDPVLSSGKGVVTAF
jgi:hypothetical protein